MTRLWRWLCCRTGHHRETVEPAYNSESMFAVALVWRCLDCPHARTLYAGRVRTPSRRYALRGKA